MSKWSARSCLRYVCTDKVFQAPSYSSLRTYPGAHEMLLRALLSTRRTLTSTSLAAFLAAAEIAAVFAGPSSISSSAASARACSLASTSSCQASYTERAED